MSVAFEIQLIAVITAVACAIPGTFLVLRRMSMMSDAISHTVLLGIVLGFFVIGDLESPFLIFSAALMGLLTVFLTEAIYGTRLVKEDAAIGIVFPALFSIAVILISRFAGNVHLDTDAVLLGELALAPLDRLNFLGLDLPRGLVIMGTILLVNVVLTGVFYKELKLATFDRALAAALGFAPAALHYGLMAVVSITAVGAFDAVGSILVVALMIAPPAAALLLTNRLDRMLVLAGLIAAISAVLGYWFARVLDANIAGSMATMTGIVFITIMLLAPEKGILSLIRRKQKQRWDFAQAMLTIHLLNHEGTEAAENENRVDHLWEHLRWQPNFAEEVVRYAERKGVVRRRQGRLFLTDNGRDLAKQAMTH
ncbi:MAG: metal ABC transporter permease [Ardenticatenaceae bacterium]|nr:metal ABC transporter permease [Ardenticatenaceae bacterium]